ncbi:MAG: hypothetical protein DRP87_06465 [Spirochaetes bacterium]|nr:MAG: hypothetical protein DRP87_06465 [Spirochaetota bacterium]
MEHKIKKKYPSLVLNFFLVFVLSGYVTGEELPRTVPREYITDLGDRPEPLSVETLIYASLYLSGTKPDDMDSYLDKFHTFIELFKNRTKDIESSYQLGETLLLLLHENFFTTYVENQTKVDVLLETGRYNCVSSAVLYLIFGKALGLSIKTINTRDHVLCAVKTEEKYIDVETTNPYGFDPGKKKKFIDSFGNMTGYTYVPPGNYRLREEGGEKKLLSFILQNRISELERKKKYKEAVELAIDRYVFLKDEKAREDMVKEVINFCSYLNEQEQYVKALDFLEKIKKHYGEHSKFVKITGVLVNNQVASLLRERKYNEARDFLEEYFEKAAIEKQMWINLSSIITEQSIKESIGELPYEEAFKILRESFEHGEITRSFFIDYTVYLAGREANYIAEIEGWLEAAEFIETVIEIVGNDGRLLKARDAFRRNFAIQEHNRFAELFNSGNYEEAIEVLESALKKSPQSDILKRDLSVAREALKEMQ